MIRFVDSDKQIRKDFIGFITVERITGESLATALLSWLESHNVNVSLCRGQGYNGASNMSSSISGVQGRINSVSPVAFYTHCQSLLYSLSEPSCSIPQVRNSSGVISKIAKFLHYSPKRQHFLSTSLMQSHPKRQRQS